MSAIDLHGIIGGFSQDVMPYPEDLSTFYTL